MRYALWFLLLTILFPASGRAQILFHDEFTGGKSPKWIQVNDGSDSGTFRVQGGAYILSSRDA
ncbi:MAG TPA: hypothetical protein VLR94_05635, partial [Acidobacteriota bacterium]|nr:hypothetical protein [Acidobacteriota bacterium]